MGSERLTNPGDLLREDTPMSDDAFRKEKRIERKAPLPHHDQPCQRILYSDSKTLFEMLKHEAENG